MKKIICLFIIIIYSCSPDLCLKDVELNYKYTPVEGKFIGIWPGDILMNTFRDLQILADEFGMKGIYLSAYNSEYTKLIKGWVNTLNLYVLKDISLDNWEKNILEYDAQFYYVDEPDMAGGSGVTREGVEQRRDFIKVIKPGSVMIISGTLNLLRDNYIPISGCGYMYSRYLEDQSEDWRVIKKKLGGGFEMSWIKVGDGCDEYVNLLSTANELGLKWIWLYGWQDNDVKSETIKHLHQFCQAAIRHGWLKNL